MLKRTSDPLADGLGVKQDMPPAQVQEARERYGMPHNFIGGFPISSLSHISNQGKFKRDFDFDSSHRVAEQRQQQQVTIQQRPITIQQQQSQLQTQLLRQQLAQPSKQPIRQPVQQPTQPQSKPNYAGQYVKPPKVDQRTINLEPKPTNNIQQQPQSNQYQQPTPNQNQQQLQYQRQQQLQQQKLNDERKLKNLQREQQIAQLKRKIRQEEQGMGR